MKKIYATITPSSSKGSTKSISELIEYLENYKQNLNSKLQEFIDRLLDVGIQTAQDNTGKYGSYIQFSKRIEGSTDKTIGFLIGTDKELPVEWETKNGKQGYNVRPLLLAEFGSGWLAEVLYDYRNISGVGQGTMPNAKGHATDIKGWYWVDNEGYHHSYGEKPTYPMYSAISAMVYDVDRIANEVFNG